MSQDPFEPRPWWIESASAEPSPREPDRADEEVLPAEVTSCWRCGKYVEAAHGPCPYCRAVLYRDQQDTNDRPRPGGAHAAVQVLAFFAVLLVIALIYGYVLRFSLKSEAALRPAEAERHLTGMLVVQGLGGLLVGVAVLWIGRFPSSDPVSSTTRLAAWLLAAPGLVLLFLVNLAYHWLIRNYLRVPLVGDELVRVLGLSAWVWAAYCVLPALEEEVFFRYLALGSLLDVVGRHGAVWVSAVMFALAHIYAPVSIPYLILVGAALGYARLLSGGILLPVLLHFGHNALVLLFDRLL